MKEHPIIFSGPMVRAILEGRKTQTRRVMAIQPSLEFCPSCCEQYAPLVVDRDGEEIPGSEIFGCYDLNGEDEGYKFPYGQIGDRLWVREAWRCYEISDRAGLQQIRSAIDQGEEIALVPGLDGVLYRADHEFRVIQNTQAASEAWGKAYRPDIWLPAWRPSIHMPRWASRITLEIVKVWVERVADITLADIVAEGVPLQPARDADETRGDYLRLWDKLNAKRGYPWSSNPWVWVIEFRRAPNEA